MKYKLNVGVIGLGVGAKHAHALYLNKNVKLGYNILIHCKKGISRSPTIVAYYLMRKMFERMKSKCIMEPVMDDILRLIHINRPCSNLNKTFIQQLKKYEYNNIK